MRDSIWCTLSIAEVVLALLIIVATAFFGDCPRQIETAAGEFVPMRCHWAFLACDVMAGIAVVAGLLLLTSKGEESRRKVAICCLAIFVAIVLTVDVVMGVCAGNMSECKTTAMVLTIIALVGAVVALAQALKPTARRLPRARL